MDVGKAERGELGDSPISGSGGRLAASEARTDLDREGFDVVVGDGVFQRAVPDRLGAGAQRVGGGRSNGDGNGDSDKSGKPGTHDPLQRRLDIGAAARQVKPDRVSGGRSASEGRREDGW